MIFGVVGTWSLVESLFEDVSREDLLFSEGGMGRFIEYDLVLSSKLRGNCILLSSLIFDDVDEASTEFEVFPAVEADVVVV